MAKDTVHRAVTAKTDSILEAGILNLLSEDSLTKPPTQTYSTAADSYRALGNPRTRCQIESTSFALRRHLSIGAKGAGRDIVVIISSPHHLLSVLDYGIIGAGGIILPVLASSTVSDLSAQLLRTNPKTICCTESTKYIALNAAEEAGWGRNGGGRVAIMSEGEKWGLRVVQADFQLGPNIVDEGLRLPWETVTDHENLSNTAVVLRDDVCGP